MRHAGASAIGQSPKHGGVAERAGGAIAGLCAVLAGVVAEDAIGIGDVGVIVEGAVGYAGHVFVEIEGVAGIAEASAHIESVAGEEALGIGGDVVVEEGETGGGGEIDEAAGDAEEGVSIEILTVEVCDRCGSCIDWVARARLVVYDNI